MKKLNLDQLHNCHFHKGGRGAGFTTLAIVNLIGYLEVLDSTSDENEKIIIIAGRDEHIPSFISKMFDVIEEFYPQYRVIRNTSTEFRVHPFINPIVVTSFKHHNHNGLDKGRVLKSIFDHSSITH